jgi:hypothetical protein
MKTTLLGVALGGMLLVPAAYGVDEHPREKAAPAAKAPKVQVRPQADDKSVAEMQEHMKKMQDIMARMQKTTNPAERQKLMSEHMEAMREGMKTMRGVSGTMQGTMGPKEGAASGMGGGGPLSPEVMERRMSMMQMMMEQMMQHQKASESPPK